MHLSHSEEETRLIAAKIAGKVKNGGLIYLYGDLGSGKTAFVKGLAQALGIDHFTIKSPTYNYIRKYGNLYHIDLYRLDIIDELLGREIQELAHNKKNIIIIEWADKLGDLDLPRGISVMMKYHSEESREIEIND